MSSLKGRPSAGWISLAALLLAAGLQGGCGHKEEAAQTVDQPNTMGVTNATPQPGTAYQPSNGYQPRSASQPVGPYPSGNVERPPSLNQSRPTGTTNYPAYGSGASQSQAYGGQTGTPIVRQNSDPQNDPDLAARGQDIVRRTGGDVRKMTPKEQETFRAAAAAGHL